MTFHCVTTMNAAGWEETGRRMAQSFVERWTESARLTVYAEGFEPDVDGIEVRRLPPWIAEFKARHATIVSHNGQMNGRYDYRFDAVKFAHKVAAMTDFGVDLTDGVMIWLDADTFTHANVTEAWLNSLFPASAYLAWLERRGSHPETGFVMFRASHPFHTKFMASFQNLYTSDEIFRLAETHDAAVLHHVVTVKAAAGKIPAPHNISGPATNWHHPFIEGALGACLDHMKGPRKQLGHSYRRDLRTQRSEAYWNAIPR